MDIQAERQTAIILQFPAGRRRPARAVSAVRAVAPAVLQPIGLAALPIVECGSCWYHEAAINEVYSQR